MQGSFFCVFKLKSQQAHLVKDKQNKRTLITAGSLHDSESPNPAKTVALLNASYDSRYETRHGYHSYF
jgi:hypothetical protein